MLTTFLVIMVVGVLGFVALAVILGLIGAVIGIAGFLLFKVAPIVLLGYLIVRFLKPRHKRLSAEDRRWLEGE
jgi:hypothetical protein